jgi:hypothetical protein
MGLKGRIMELIRRGDNDGLERLAEAEPRVARHLLGRLWDVDESTRAMAAKALGVIAEAHPDLGLEVTRRLMWALNDESAMNGVYGLAALGEIGQHNPTLFAPFAGPMAAYLWDDGLRLGILKALAQIHDEAPEITMDIRDLVERFADPGCPGEYELVRRILGEKGEYDEA